MRTRLFMPLVAAALAACADSPPSAPAAVETYREIANVCPGLGDGCVPVSDEIDIASIDIGDAYIESVAGRRYYVSWSTQFLRVVPPNPIIPTDPLYGTVTSWNALVASNASYRAFLGQLRQVPPNPIRFQATALSDGTTYYLTSLQPVLAQ